MADDLKDLGLHYDPERTKQPKHPDAIEVVTITKEPGGWGIYFDDDWAELMRQDIEFGARESGKVSAALADALLRLLRGER